MKKSLFFCAALFVFFSLAQTGLAQQFLPDTEYKKAIPGDSMLVQDFQRAAKLSNMLMAPCCYSKTAAEDQSGMAYSVKMEVRRGILEGHSDDEILSGFARVYGERILAQPKATGFNRMAWIMPIVALLVGAAIYVVFIRKTSAKPHADNALSKKSAEKAEPEDPYLRRLERELEDFES